MTPSLLVSLSGVLLVFQVVGYVSGLSTLQSTVSRKKNIATLMLMDNQVAIAAINRLSTTIYHYVPNKQDLRDEGHAHQCLL